MPAPWYVIYSVRKGADRRKSSCLPSISRSGLISHAVSHCTKALKSGACKLLVPSPEGESNTHLLKPRGPGSKTHDAKKNSPSLPPFIAPNIEQSVIYKTFAIKTRYGAVDQKWWLHFDLWKIPDRHSCLFSVSIGTLFHCSHSVCSVVSSVPLFL
jgi:hypothetical protein